MRLPEEPVLAWVESSVGPFRIVSHFAHDHAYSQLWRLATAQGSLWLKMHAHGRKWAGEVHALTVWADSLAPEVVAWRDEPRAVLLTERPGTNAESIDLTLQAEARLWSEAGAWLREFHARTNDWMGDVRPDGSPWGMPATDPVDFTRHRIETRLFQGREQGLIEANEFDFVEGSLREGLPSLEGARFRSIHRDFTPRNWLADSNGRLTAVIDFEHARWDLRAADLNRPWDWDFARNPRLVDAFYEAYGPPDDRFMAQIQTLRLVNAVTGIVWAVEVGDFEFSAQNRLALSRMMRGELG